MARLLLIAALAAFPFTANAQTACAPRDKILKSLTEQWGEQRLGLGLSKNGNVVEFLASEQGTWSILVTYPNGKTCLVVNGEAWEAVPLTPGDPA